MNEIAKIISKYTGMEWLELAYRYIYLNNIPLEKIDYNSDIYKNFFKTAEDRLSMSFMCNTFKRFTTSLLHSIYLPTNVLIPPGKGLYIRQLPRYMPGIMHYHEDAMEINCLLNGEITQTINNTPIHMKPGDMCFIAPHSIHGPFLADDSVVMFSILIYVNVLKDKFGKSDLDSDLLSEFLFRILYGREFLPFLLCETGMDPFIIELLLDMMENKDGNDIYTDTYMRTSLELLFLRLLKKHRGNITTGQITLKDNNGAQWHQPVKGT